VRLDGRRLRDGIWNSQTEESKLVYRWIDGSVYRKSTEPEPAMTYLTVFREKSPISGDSHQQYLEKSPDGYCGLGGTGVSCPIGLTTADSVGR
jgi:peptide-methionine (S)-S-oxide reductase